MTRPGATRLFEVKGITVFLHWSWFLAAVFEISGRTQSYSFIGWNLIEYLALFAVVTLHEFGHALACRSVGGRADEILLWPLGGVAIVDPPPRPGATLWSIAAGPLVNFALMPVFAGLTLLTPAPSDLHTLLRSVTLINVGLLVFNLLPIYPLDGGQILGALLWPLVGRPRSLVVTAVVGLAGVAGIGWVALTTLSPWLGLLALFAGQRCLHSFRVASALQRMADAPTRQGVACPSCHAAPPIGAFWGCSACGAAFDVFDPAAGAVLPQETTTLNLSAHADRVPSIASGTECPNCHAEAAGSKCLQCGAVAAIAGWKAAAMISTALSESAGVTRRRAPRPPSVAPMVAGVGLFILAVLGLLATLFFFAMSLRPQLREVAPLVRGLAAAALTISLMLAGGAIALLARFRRRRTIYVEALRAIDEPDVL